MTLERTDEQLLRDWMTETVWLPDSDLAVVQDRIHRTPQHRGLLPPLDPGGFVRMFSATGVVVAGAVLALIVGFFALGLLPGAGDPTTPGVAIPAIAPEDEGPAIAVPSAEPEASELAIIAPDEPPVIEAQDAPAPKRIHWEDGGITLDADAIRIEAFGRTFEPTTLKWLSHDYKGNRINGLPPAAIIEAHWTAGREAMRLRLDLRSDGEHWWIQRAHTFGDKDEPDNPLAYPSLKDETLTRVGERMKVSIDTARPAKGIRLRIDDLRIDAFRSGTIPAYSPKPKNPKLNVSVESKTMLPGQRQRLTAEWCLEGECWPAQDVRWRSDDPDIVDYSPSNGSWTEVTALQPGRGSVTGRTQGQRDVRTFWVYPRPSGGDIPADMDPPSVAVATPDTATLKLGQHVILTSWRCPTTKAKQVGADGRPGTDDDDCEVEDTEGVRSIGESTLSLVELVGPSALLRVDGFGGLGGNVAPSPVEIGFLDHRTLGEGEDARVISTMRLGIANLYVRDAPWRGSRLGDLDGDGAVTTADMAVLATGLEEGPSDRGDARYRTALDLNRDHRVDGVDSGLLEALVRSHAGEAPGEPVSARGSWFGKPPASAAVDDPGAVRVDPTVATTTLTSFVAARIKTAANGLEWSDGGVSFSAADFTIETNGRTFKPRRTDWTNGHHSFYRTVGDHPRDAELESHWRAQGTEMRLRFELKTDGTDWWIHRIRTYDGTRRPDYLSYAQLKARTRTPLGEAFTGSLSVRATGPGRSRLVPDARVRIEDMRLEAFDLVAIPSPQPRARQPELMVEMDQSALLRGQSLRAEARWCLREDDCWPADDIRWYTDTPDVVKVEPRRGSWTRVTALSPGSADLSYKGGNTHGSIGFVVAPRPGRIDDHEDVGYMRWHLTTPREQVLKLGQYTVMTGWICPLRERGRLGQDGKPGTSDDRCRTDDVRGVWVRPGSGLAIVGTSGPSAVLVADSFELENESLMSAWAGLSFDFRKGSDFGTSNLYIRDGQWRGPLLGDLDQDGAVDAADVAIVADTIAADGPRIRRGGEGWRKRLDLNVDYVIDQVDADIIAMLADAHGGVLEPVVPTPLPERPFELERSSKPSPEPARTVEPARTPEPSANRDEEAGIAAFVSGKMRRAARAVHWSDGGVTFEARDFVIEANGLTFKPGKPQWTTGGHGPLADSNRSYASADHEADSVGR